MAVLFGQLPQLDLFFAYREVGKGREPGCGGLTPETDFLFK